MSADTPASFTVTGTLDHAEVRTEYVEGHNRPVLFMELHDVGPGKHKVHARHAYTEQTRREAESWAERLKKGTRVTIAAPLRDLHLSVPEAVFAIAPPENQKELEL